MRYSSFFVLILVFALWAAPVLGEILPSPEPVPYGVSAQCANLLGTRRAKLVAVHQRHERTIVLHESRCSFIPESNTALIEECYASRQTIELEVSTYLDAIDDFASVCRKVREAVEVRSKVADLNAQLVQAENKAASAKNEMERITRRLQNYQVQIAQWTELSLAARKEAIDTATSVTIDALVNRMLKIGEELSADAFAKAMKRMDAVRSKLMLRNPDKYAAVLKAADERAQGLGKTATLMVLGQMIKNGIDDFYASDSVQHGKDREEVLGGLLQLTTSAAGFVIPAAPYVAADSRILAALAGGWSSYFVAKTNVLKLLELTELDAELVTSATSRYLRYTDLCMTLKVRQQRIRDSVSVSFIGCP